MISPERRLPETFVPGEKGTQGEGILLATARNVRWAARLGNFSCGTPTVAGGKVFIGGMVDRQGIMKCFDEATGKLLWQWIKPCRSDLKEDAMNFRQFPKSLGVCSTPAVDGDRLYFVDQNCVVECLDTQGQPPTAGAEAGEAKVIWTFDMYADKAVGSRPSDACNGSPLIDGDLLYVTTANGVDRIIEVPIEEDAARRCFAPNAPTLIVLDKRTGRFLARDTAPTAANMLHGQWSSPSLGTVQGRKLVFLGGGDGNCYAFSLRPSTSRCSGSFRASGGLLYARMRSMTLLSSVSCVVVVRLVMFIMLLLPSLTESLFWPSLERPVSSIGPGDFQFTSIVQSPDYAPTTRRAWAGRRPRPSGRTPASPGGCSAKMRRAPWGGGRGERPGAIGPSSDAWPSRRP